MTTKEAPYHQLIANALGADDIVVHYHRSDESWRKLVDEGQANIDRCLEHRRQLDARIRNLRSLLARERLFRRQWQEEARRNYYRLQPRP